MSFDTIAILKDNELLRAEITRLTEALEKAMKKIEKMRETSFVAQVTIEQMRPYFTHWDSQVRGHGPQSSIWHTSDTPVTYKHHEAVLAALVSPAEKDSQ